MGNVFERMAWDLEFAGRAERTRKVYLADARALMAFHGKSPEELGQADLRVTKRATPHSLRHTYPFQVVPVISRARAERFV